MCLKVFENLKIKKFDTVNKHDLYSKRKKKSVILKTKTRHGCA